MAASVIAIISLGTIGAVLLVLLVAASKQWAEDQRAINSLQDQNQELKEALFNPSTKGRLKALRAKLRRTDICPSSEYWEGRWKK